MKARVHWLTTSDRTASRSGIPSTITPGNAILTAVAEHQSSDIPQAFVLQLNLAYISYQWIRRLGDDESMSSGQCSSPESFIQTFDSQCLQLRERFAGTWPRLVEIAYYAMQLQVYSFVIHKRTSTLSSTESGNALSIDLLQAKMLAILVRMTSKASKEDATRPQWPVFARYHVILAATTCVYMAAATSERTTRLTLLEACKETVPILESWSMFARDQAARVAKHIAVAIRKLEACGGEAANNGSRRLAISARMAANIPLQVIWSTKHAWTSNGAGPATTFPSTAARTVDHQDEPVSVAPSMLQTQPEVFNYPSDYITDASFSDYMDDTDFTDIFMDWQSLRGNVPEWT